MNPLNVIFFPFNVCLCGQRTELTPADMYHVLAGDTVLIVDCGGGTVDTTTHSCKFMGNGGLLHLAEATCADGALCGAVYVDVAFL